jgi:hypothetical protein
MRRIGATFFLLLVLAISLFVVAEMGGWLWRSARMYGWTRLDCTIEASAVERHPEAVNAGQEFRFVVAYRYSYQGRQHEGDRYTPGYSGGADSTETHRLSASFPPGARVACWVDPRQPEQAVLVRPNLWYGFLLAIPLLFAAAGGAGLYLLWRGRGEGADDGRVPAGAAVAPGRARGCMVVFLACFALYGAGLFLGVFFRPWSRLVSARAWPATSCVIQASQMRSHPPAGKQGRTTWSADVVYAYVVGDRRHESNRYDFLGSGSSGGADERAILERYPAGSTTVCYVNPDDPAEAVLSRDFRPAYLLGLLPVAMVFLGAAGAVRVWRGRWLLPGARAGGRPERGAGEEQERGDGEPE